VRRRWTYARVRPGRPSIDAEKRELVTRFGAPQRTSVAGQQASDLAVAEGPGGEIVTWIRGDPPSHADGTVYGRGQRPTEEQARRAAATLPERARGRCRTYVLPEQRSLDRRLGKLSAVPVDVCSRANDCARVLLSGAVPVTHQTTDSSALAVKSTFQASCADWLPARAGKLASSACRCSGANVVIAATPIAVGSTGSTCRRSTYRVCCSWRARS
jgi:hypothetical protein